MKRAKAEFLQITFGENIVKAAYEKLNEQNQISGLPYDNRPLPNISTPNIITSQQALAQASRYRKPYYAK